MPRIGTSAELWPEVLDCRYDLAPCVSEGVTNDVNRLLEGLPRPIVAIHTRGVTGTDKKNFPPKLEGETIRGLLDFGSVVYLDWDGSGLRGDHPRLVRASGYSVERLAALILASDVLVGIDSGPYHLARLTNTRRIGCWWGIPPFHAALPRAGDVNLFGPHRLNEFKADAFHIREVPEINATAILNTVWIT